MSKALYKERNNKIFKLYTNGISIKQLSKEFKVSEIRVRQILKQHSDKANNVVNFDINDIRYLKLSNKSEITLLRAGINTVAELTNLNKEKLLSIRGLGIHSYNEIVEALHRIGKDFIKVGF